jgi:hypothetical protein
MNGSAKSIKKVLQSRLQEFYENVCQSALTTVEKAVKKY